MAFTTVVIRILLIVMLTSLSITGSESNGRESNKGSPPIKSGLVLKCFWFETSNFVFYDLKKLENSGSTPYSFTAGDHSTVYYNFCGNVMQKTCNGAQYQILSHNTEKDCQPFSGSYMQKNIWELLDPKNITRGVKITLNSYTDKSCNEKGDKYTVVYEVECDKQAQAPLITNVNQFNKANCLNTLRFRSSIACPDTNILSVIQFFEDKKEIFASVIIIGGLYLLILGTKLLPATTYLISFVCLASLVFIVLIQFTIPSNAVNAVIWAVLGISAVVGGVIGFFIAKYKKEVIGFVLGGYSGYVVGTLLYTSVTCRFFPEYALLMNIITDVVMIIVFILIAYFFFRHIVIFCTSLIGSYGIVRGIGTLVGNFPSERVIISLLQKGETEQWKKILTPWLYGYLAGWVVLFIGGVIVQYFLTKEEKNIDLPSKTENLVKSWD